MSALLAVLVFASVAHAAGELDPTFDGDGRVVTDLGTFEHAHGVAIQADGKIVVAGEGFGNFELTRYNADGSLDATFDGDGRVTTDFGAADGASDVAIQADGKVVVGGSTGTGANPADFALARYNASGSLDTTFDGDGRVTTDFGATDAAFDVAITADGDIVAAGSTRAGAHPYNFALARYTADGSLDTTFDGDGRVMTDFGGEDVVNGVAIQADGKVVAAGRSYFGNFALARYDLDGGLDASFGGDGKVVTDFAPFDEATSVAIQADGKIVAAGDGGTGPNPRNFELARYNPDGSLDGGFDGDGKVVTDFGASDVATSVEIQDNGRIVAAGWSPAAAPYPPNNFALARYKADGSLDASFGGDGTVLTDFGGDDSVSDLAIQADGRIIAAGSTCRCDGSDNPSDFALARYLPTGSVQPQISINDVSRLEGNAGQTPRTFTISLSNPSSQTVTVSLQTADSSASAPSDYAALAPIVIRFFPGQTHKVVTVSVTGDVAIEPNESFFVNLSSPTNATIADDSGKGTILTDDLSASAPCTITGTNGNDVLNGTAGNDVICGGKGYDQINGLDGSDVLKGESGNDVLVGGNGADLLVGSMGADDLRGESGNDTLRGGGNDDTLDGSANSDALFGDSGTDSLNTQDGAPANDRADGGSGNDTCIFDSGDFVTSCP